MVDDILRGTIRVLKRQGGRHFTTIRVAEETGISVGSLYQYFPNKESLLFQVQHREWLATSQMILSLIADRRHAPAERLTRMIRAFFQSELEETALRKALAETGIMMEDTEQFRNLKAGIFSGMNVFLGELAPGLKLSQRQFLARFVFTTISSLAEQVTSSTDSEAEVKQWAASCAGMILSFIRENRQG